MHARGSGRVYGFARVCVCMHTGMNVFEYASCIVSVYVLLYVCNECACACMRVFACACVFVCYYARDAGVCLCEVEWMSVREWEWVYSIGTDQLVSPTT